MTASVSGVICMEYVIYSGKQKNVKSYRYTGRASSYYDATLIARSLNQKGLNVFILTYYPNGKTSGEYKYAPLYG